MIDHVSIAVRDLASAGLFYDGLLAALGMARVREWPGAAIGYGKKYPEFWLNIRRDMPRVADDSGVHICLRAPDRAAVDAFYDAALAGGGTSYGAPGFRKDYNPRYYAAFVRDNDGNRIEAVTFIDP
ncbi:MAG: VOC family protein [Pseudolabrys sp.]|nr:VOC family protein [Pseudolabrys sp.]